MKQLMSKIKKWDTELPYKEDAPDTISKYTALIKKLEYFSEKHWNKYLPTQNSKFSPNYLIRLGRWLSNTDNDDDQRLLLEFASEISFFTDEDFRQLYQAAYNGPISRWIIDLERITFQNIQTQLIKELSHTWFCPITDSLIINEFYHVNDIVGISEHPSFATLTKLGEIDNIKKLMEKPNSSKPDFSLKRLVLLEDFVGSGSQSIPVLEFVVNNLNVPILFVPLIISTIGAESIRTLVGKHPSKISFSPILELGNCDLLGPERKNAEGHPLTEKFEEIATRTFSSVAGTTNADPKVPPYDPFGFKKTGTTIVLYSNTPNNSLPLIHHRPNTNSWEPLFPRVNRV